MYSFDQECQPNMLRCRACNKLVETVDRFDHERECPDRNMSTE